jgi:hypothetical protein
MNNILYLKTFTYYNKADSIERLILLDKNNEDSYFFNYNFFNSRDLKEQIRSSKELLTNCDFLKKIYYKTYDKYYISDLQKKFILIMTKGDILNCTPKELFLKIGSIEYLI